jgi:hypothetical protein
MNGEIRQQQATFRWVEPAPVLWASMATIAHSRYAPFPCTLRTVRPPTDTTHPQIFLYGGYLSAPSDIQSQADNEIAERVYILSIPSFSWHVAYDLGVRARSFHSCNIHNRQLIVIGGIEPVASMKNESVDAWAQGLGLFDCTDLKWKTNYDSAAAPYKTAKKIKEYLATNGKYPRIWNDGMVQAWITGQGTSASHQGLG